MGARAAAGALSAAAAFAAGPAEARPLPDLHPRAVTAPAVVPVGSRFTARVVIANRGRRGAGRSTVGLFLSRDRRRGAGDLRLGRHAVRPIGRGRRVTVRKRLTLPADASGSYRLIACADLLRRVRERHERDNCVAGRRAITAAAFQEPPASGGTPGSDPPPQPEPEPQPEPPPPQPQFQTLIAAGDIASCDSNGDEATAALLRSPPDATVAALGDLVYGGASLADFTGCYDPSWGAAKARTRPALGNHEYDTAGAAGYFAYWGTAAGERGKGWYSYDLGTWHVVVLNSNCDAVGGCQRGSEQERWLEADLTAHPAACTLAYWHDPLFTSDQQTGPSAETLPLWQALYAARAEIVLNGHAHEYERFGPQRPDGSADAAGGIREFVVGTGGRSFGAFGGPPAPNSERRYNGSFGVISLRLAARSYSWRFIPVAGSTFSDSGSGACH